jgi:hypothetical protein
VLAFLKDYIVFAEKDEELNKYILRQHQTGAVDATVSRALDPKRTRGLVSGSAGNEHSVHCQNLATDAHFSKFPTRALGFRQRRWLRSGYQNQSG